MAEVLGEDLVQEVKHARTVLPAGGARIPE